MSVVELSPVQVASLEMGQERGSRISTMFVAADVLSGGERRVRRSGGGSVRRFCSVVLHPVPVLSGFFGGLLTVVVAVGAWVGLTWGVVPSSKVVTVQTPVGPHSLVVAVTRWPSSVAIGLGICLILCVVAGIRLAGREPDAF